MLKVRIIPCLDVKDGRVVKGVNFVDLVDAESGEAIVEQKAFVYSGDSQWTDVLVEAGRIASVGSVGDVAADVALLATDLASRGRTDLAERFLAEYAGLANDFDLYPLLDFHASLRAAIRAKLDWVCADHEHAGSAGEAGQLGPGLLRLERYARPLRRRPDHLHRHRDVGARGRHGHGGVPRRRGLGGG